MIKQLLSLAWLIGKLLIYADVNVLRAFFAATAAAPDAMTLAGAAEGYPRAIAGCAGSLPEGCAGTNDRNI